MTGLTNTVPSSLGDDAYKRSLAANQRADHVVATAGFSSYSLCRSVVRAFAHGAMGRRIDPSWGGPRLS